MKKRLNAIHVALTCVIASLSCICCNSNPTANGDDSKPTVNASELDSLLVKIARGKLENVAIVSGVKMNVALNAAPYLIGKLYNLKVDDRDSSINLTGYNDFNYLRSSEKVDSKVIDDKPDFEAYIKSGLTANIGSTSTVELTAKGSAENTTRIKYSTIFSNVAKQDFMDDTKFEADARSYNFSRHIPNPVIIETVTVKRLAYQKFKKLEGSLTGGITALVNIDGTMYYEDGTEENIYEVYVTFSNLLLRANGNIDRREPTRITRPMLNRIRIEDQDRPGNPNR